MYTDCGYPRWSVFFTLPNAIFFYFLFNDFYTKSYKPKDGKSNGTNGAIAIQATENETKKLTQNGFSNNNNELKCNNNLTSEKKKIK